MSRVRRRTRTAVRSLRIAARAPACRTASSATAPRSVGRRTMTRPAASDDAICRRSPTRRESRSVSVTMSATSTWPTVVDEPFPFEDLGVGADDRRRRLELVRCVRDEPPLGGHRPPDRNEGTTGDQHRDDRRAEQADDTDQGDRRDQAVRLLVVERHHEATLDVSDRRLARRRHHGLGQQPDLDPADVHRPKVTAVRAGRRDGSRVGQAGEVDSRRVGDLVAGRVEVQEQRVGSGGRCVVRFARRFATGKLAVESRDRRIDRRGERPIHVQVERSKPDEGRGGADHHDQRGDQRERGDEQAAPGRPEQPRGRFGHRCDQGSARRV